MPAKPGERGKEDFFSTLRFGERAGVRGVNLQPNTEFSAEKRLFFGHRPWYVLKVHPLTLPSPPQSRGRGSKRTFSSLSKAGRRVTEVLSSATKTILPMQTRRFTLPPALERAENVGFRT